MSKKKTLEERQKTVLDSYGGLPALADAIRKIGPFSRLDDWVNTSTGIGTSRDKRTSTFFRRTQRLTLQWQTLDDLYHGNDLAKKICDIYAEESTREWLEIKIQEENGAEIAAELANQMRTLQVQRKTSEAVSWARLFGGSVMLLGIDDGQKADMPVNYENIKSLNWILVLDRWYV